MSEQVRPQGWKNYDDFAAGIDSNRLPQSRALIGRDIHIAFDDTHRLDLVFTGTGVSWTDETGSGEDSCDTVDVAANTFFVDIAFSGRPTEAETLIINLETRRVLSIKSIVRDADAAPGEPRVAQIFRPGRIEDRAQLAASVLPAPTRDLIGLRAHFTYSPNHVYEHTYLSSQRYCWQCLVGVQRGHGDVDLTTTYKFDHCCYRDSPCCHSINSRFNNQWDSSWENGSCDDSLWKQRQLRH